ncbi:MAG: SpoVR family protein [Acidobacteriota bacterium]|nr:SpoVR family protein [Acidobacteriota bacterium]MDH3785912.1 SpoVR family protein [Acidobacteriota bacterium]
MKLIPLPLELARAQETIEAIARDECGLDFYRTVFEMVDYEQMNALAAYGGFPTRYPHYRFGMEYQQLSKSYEYGLHKIYEMVINNDPTYAYLLEGNMMLDQKLVMAHVYGHADFFKTNMYFGHTNRRMIDEMANHATRIRRYQERFGVGPVERFIDSCLAIEDLIDPNAVFRGAGNGVESVIERPPVSENVGKMEAKQYMDRYINPPEYLEAQQAKLDQAEQSARKFPAQPERDLMGFLLKHAPLDNWERDVLDSIREEAYYFLPQRQTKVMNEGWACYWHSKIMTGRVLTDAEVIDYADHHSGTVATQPGRLNPYKLGLELFRDIKRRWDMGQFGSEWGDCQDMAERHAWDRETGLGLEKIFEVRRVHCDATFLDAFLTPEFCAEQKLFVSKEQGAQPKTHISSREFAEIKQMMLFQFTNGGRPVIELVDANYANRGELLLTHDHVGIDLRWDWAAEVLREVVQLWRRPVNLETLREGKAVRLRHDGENASEEDLEAITRSEAKAS